MQPDNNGFAQTASYVLGLSGEQISELDGSDGFKRSQVYANGELLATYNTTTVEFPFSDWLGTKRVVANTLGAAIGTCASLPFGDALGCTGGLSLSGHHFTGQLHDAESGNDYFGARYYGDYTGRFMSPDDGSDQDPSDPQSWNLYSYVQNNPLRNVDPDGHDCVTQSRVDGSTESVSVSSGGCSGVAGNGTTQTYVNGTVNLSDIHTGADGHSIDIGFTGADGSTGVQNANSAPYADNPGISLGNNQPGMFQMSGTNRVVNQIGGAMFAATTYFMGGLLGDTAPETGLLSGVGKTRVSINWAHQLLDVRPGHLPPPGSQDLVQQAIQAAVDQGKFSTSANGVVEGTTEVLGTDVGFRGKMVDGVLRVSTVFTKR
jgi:RHS repeat-associated protein